MEIVGAFACSHAGLLVTRRDLAPPDMCREVYSGFARMGQAILDAEPDAVLLVATDHMGVYSFAAVPQFTIGVSATARCIGDAGLPCDDLPIHHELARAVLQGALEEGVDLGFSEEMRLDHSFITPLLLAFSKQVPPIIPIAQNCNVPPMPPLRRSYEVGKRLGRAMRNGPDGRVAVIGTGGLSHWVGSPEFRRFMRKPAGSRIAVQSRYPVSIDDEGPINEEFDRAFIDSICAGRAADFLSEWTTERLYEEAGNGGQEIRNWLLVAGLMDDAPASLLAYAPVVPWLTGTGIVSFRT